VLCEEKATKTLACGAAGVSKLCTIQTHASPQINDGYGGRRWPSIHIRDIDIGTGTESQHMSSSANETVFQGYDNALLDRSCMNDSSLAAAPCVVIGAR
jgi:hypothetical protein